MQILLLSENDYLSGLLKGYCINVNYNVDTVKHCHNFYKSLNKEPLIIFIDMTLLPRLVSMANWQKAELFIKEKNIILCGFGGQLFDNKNIQSTSVFTKIFPSPFNTDQIIRFLQKILIENELSKKERRNRERRNRIDRRNFLTQLQTSPSPGEQQNSEGDINIGSLIINRAHKNITINDIPVNLSHKEFEIIDYLATNSGSVVATKDIIKMVWANCTRATKADVHQYVHMLRKKIEIDPHNPKLLITVKGFGYELCP